MKQLTIFSILFFFCFSEISGQRDWGSWSSFQLNYKAGDKISLSLKPIVRHKSNFSEYDNTSIDLIISYKINDAWKINALNRHWFMPDQGDREFWFFELAHSLKLSEKFSLAHKLRYHLALDWNREDIDFIRYMPKLTYQTGKKITPFVALDYFFRLTTKRVLAGARYKAGLNATLSKKIKLTAEYWGQVKHNDEYPIQEINLLVFNVAFRLN